LTPFMPPSQRIISIEDTREVSLPEFLHWVPMTTREQNPDGQGEVSMQDLLVNSLRMRPDRILVGEIRRKRQAEVLFEAMQTGHSVYSTLHADTAETTIKRMTNPPIDVPEAVVGAVDLNVVMFRDRRRNFRRVMEIAEVIDEDGLHPHTVYSWDSQEDAFYKDDKSNQVMEKLKMVTGLTDEEISENLDDKKSILKWMVRNDVTDLDNVGKVVAEYYSREDELLEKIHNNADVDELLTEEDD
jgi:flagellar protein FlaI